MHNHPHPDLEQLDMLRAGLLDDAPDEKTIIERHLAECAACRAQSGQWQRLAAIMENLPQEETLRDDLQRARQTALAAKPALPRWSSAIPYAAAAMLLLAVSTGILTLPTGQVTSPAITTQTAQSIPDTYEDLDFYLWLSSQDEGHSDKDRANPNNT
jgi:anti-sigma factor RsiW